MRGNLSVLSITIDELGLISLIDIKNLRRFIAESSFHAVFFGGKIQEVNTFESFLSLFEEVRGFSISNKMDLGVNSLLLKSVKKPQQKALFSIKSKFYELDQLNLKLLHYKMYKAKRGILFCA